MRRDYSLDDLRYLMRRLRDPKTGCPWDIKQDFLSITSSTIEEAYEVVDAIEKGIPSDIKEELGDLLFQIIFYGQLAEEENHFAFGDIVQCLTEKLIRRHPHVFPDGTLQSVRTESLDNIDIKTQWEKIKAQERKNKGHAGVLDDIPSGLPAMTRAVKIQKRAARYQFDWPDISPVIDKLQEELAELKEALQSADPQAIEDEMGDVLFTAVNLARHCNVEPEAALRRANYKFARRFEYLIRLAEQRNITLRDASLDVMEALWQEAKQSLGSD